MAYHESWTNKDLIEYMIKRDYPGFTELHTFECVLHGGQFYAVSLIQNDTEKLAVFSQRECQRNCFRFLTKKTIRFADRNEGNAFFKKVKGSQRTSKRDTIYYRY